MERGRDLLRASGAGAYLAAADRPAIVVVDGRPGADRGAERSFGTVPVMRRLRAALPASDALRTFVYLGDPERLLAGAHAATRRPRFRRGLPRDLGRRATAARRGPDDRRAPLPVPGVRGGRASTPTGGTKVGRDVVGPDPPATSRRPLLRTARSGDAVRPVGALPAVLSAVGAGWVVRLGGGPRWLRLALAPAIGVALLVPTCLLVERVGIRVGGIGGAFVVVALAGAGLVAAIVGREAEEAPAP